MIIHTSIDIADFLHQNRHRPLTWWGNNLIAINGKKLTGAQVVAALQRHLDDGEKLLPVGDPCAGFSYVTGCPGHPAEVID